jgi:hypothetical protein
MYFRDYILFLYLLQKVHIGITNGLLDAAKKCPCENTDMYFCNIIYMTHAIQVLSFYKFTKAKK